MSDRMDMFIFNTSFYIYQTTKTPLCLNDTIVLVLVWYLDLQLSMQSVPITTNVVSSNSAQAMYVIKFVSDLRQVGTPLSSINKDVVESGVKYHNPLL
jgi:hypothetical protein